MDLSSYLNYHTKWHRSFLLNFHSLHQILSTFNLDSIISYPYPTRKEIAAHSPLTLIHLKHIAYVLVTHHNIHSIYLQLVPARYTEEVFWTNYFKNLYYKTLHSKEFKETIKIRTSRHSKPLDKLLKQIDSIPQSFPEPRHLFFITSDGINAIKTIRTDFSSIQLPDFVTHLIHCLLTHYSLKVSIELIEAILIKVLFKEIIPNTRIQFDYFYIAFDSLISTMFPSYLREVEEMNFSITEVYDPLFTLLMSPLLPHLKNNKDIFILKKIYIEGFSFMIKLVLALIKLSTNPPKGPYDYASFIDLLNDRFDEVVNVMEHTELPPYLNYPYCFAIREDIQSSRTPIFIDDVLRPTLLPTDFLPVDTVKYLNQMLPVRVSVLEFECIFSTKTDGFSLNTLYLLVAARSPLLILIQSGKDIFGGYIPSSLRIGKNYYGTGETFIFSLTPPTIYEATKNNHYFIQTDVNCIVFGGGNGVPGLRLDRDLNGCSYNCPTFNNPPFKENNTFESARVEVWTCESLLIDSNDSLPTSADISTSNSVRMSLDL
ncbi:Oxidation resistance protein 1 [Entamoeba marina]